jgi:hypothetical protein
MPRDDPARFSLTLLENNRVMIAPGYLMKRQSCLKIPEWKAGSWEIQPESKRPLLCLVDILCDLPGILQDASSLQRQNIGTKQYIPLYEKLQDDVVNHLLALYKWRANWEEENPNSLS